MSYRLSLFPASENDGPSGAKIFAKNPKYISLIFSDLTKLLYFFRVPDAELDTSPAARPAAFVNKGLYH